MENKHLLKNATSFKKYWHILLMVFLYSLCVEQVSANFIPGGFNGWTQNTPYVTTNMPSGYKKYTVKTSNDAEFKLLRNNNSWEQGWGDGSVV